MLHVLIARAKTGKAWLALGYSSFAEYVDSEFHISRSRAYQFLDQHKVVAAIAANLPEGAEMPIVTEAAARDLKWVLEDLLAAIRERTQCGDPGDASGVVADTISEYRDVRRDLHRPPMDESQIENLRVTMSLFSALQSLTALPDPQTVTTAVPAERCAQISATLRDAIVWLTGFEKAWTEAALLTD